MFRPQKKNQSKDSESSESDSEAISQDGTQAINGEKADDDSEVEEINSSQFGPQTPDIKTYKGSLQSNQSGGEFYGNKELKAIFDEFMPTLEKESEKKIKDVFEKNLTEESDILIEEAKTNKTGLVTWVKNPQPETDEKIEANCVKIFNLHPKVCTRVLWELFSKGNLPKSFETLKLAE